MPTNDDEIGDRCGTHNAPAADKPAAPSRLPAPLPWFVAAGFALLAGFLLVSSFALHAEMAVLRDQAALAEIQERSLRQQMEADHILSARRLADLRSELQGPRDLDHLEFFPLVSPTNVASASLAVAVWDPDSQAGELAVWALPALPPDKSYQLWLFDSAHPNGYSLAIFAVDSGAAEMLVPFKLNRSSATSPRYKVILGRQGGAPAPDGTVVLASP